MPYPSTLLLAAAVFARTERLRVGLSILVLPLYHPLLLAEQVAQLDFQSGGRIDVGVGRGTDPGTFVALEIDPATSRERFEACFALIRRAWIGPTVSAQTQFWTFSSVGVGPPVQRPHPPLYVAGSTKETLTFAAANEVPLLLSLEPPEGKQLGLYREALAETGRLSQLAGSSLSRYICIGATQKEAVQQLDTLLPRLYQRRVGFAVARGTPADQVPPIDRDRFVREQAVVGDPQGCYERIIALTRELGTGELRCVFNGNGTLDNTAALAGMDLFAREVLPALRTVSPPSA